MDDEEILKKHADERAEREEKKEQEEEEKSDEYRARLAEAEKKARQTQEDLDN